MASLEVGFSHAIFVEMANEARNLVLFTEKGQVHSCAWHISLKVNADVLLLSSIFLWFQ